MPAPARRAEARRRAPPARYGISSTDLHARHSSGRAWSRTQLRRLLHLRRPARLARIFLLRGVAPHRAYHCVDGADDDHAEDDKVDADGRLIGRARRSRGRGLLLRDGETPALEHDKCKKYPLHDALLLVINGTQGLLRNSFGID